MQDAPSLMLSSIVDQEMISLVLTSLDERFSRLISIDPEIFWRMVGLDLVE